MRNKYLIAMAAAMVISGCSQQNSNPPADSTEMTSSNTETSSEAATGKYKPGIYTEESDGYGGVIKMSVEVDENQILKVEILSHSETDGIGSKAVEALPAAITEHQNTDVDSISGATISSEAIKNAVTKALNTASGNEDANAALDQKEARLFDEGWSVKPVYGITKGAYYKEQETFRQGHMGILEVVTDQEGNLLMVEFNETGRPNYYTRLYQNQDKRLSEYNFMMGESKGVAFIQGVLAAEQQIIKNQSLTDEVDTVSGASNSIQQGMLPLAKKIDERMAAGTSQTYYSIAKDIGGGLSGKLDIVIEDGNIIDCRYDEIFGDSPEEIADEKLKQHYRTSKYSSIYYEEPSRIGFNIQMDALNEKVIETQDLFDLSGLPAIEDSGDYKTAGFTLRNTAWDNYLAMAKELHEEMVKDGIINTAN